MPWREGHRTDLGDLLAAAESAAPVDAVDVLTVELAKAVGATEVRLLIADFSGNALVRLTTHAGDLAADSRVHGQEIAQRLALAGTPYETALRSQQVVIDGDPHAGPVRAIAPVTNRGEAIGVVELALPEPPDGQTERYLAAAAKAFAFVLVANRRFTDLFAWGQRSVPLSLAAEIQHRLLPDAFTCDAGQFTLAGWVEPAGEVGGDTFDYSLDRTTLHLSMTDAMGHEVDAALLATLLVGCLRNTRRAGAGLAAQAQAANQALFTRARPDQFVTGQLARIDLNTATAHIINAGHPLPLRVRAGRVEALPLAPDPPFGMFADTTYRVQQIPLEAGDRLVFLTDGVLDRNTAAADNIAADLAEAGDLHPRELVQQLTRALLRVTGGHLTDDATVLCLDWNGGPPSANPT
ncbi:PP2C family protein-serine/threonine phosphatase [Frankia sp. QA3]|uniref:PP2C family protein-serine/threonine phosphatase n=1 Tax=Frankia sp. QA3 TaxID=710111 RepID=UPI000269C11F|nr:PP2C family protein-serine/threonine phosphatase [Frankia sp. QA3]EIV92889.1 serine phosphatase RsbU, regulator of sigma subunit [Frankia sp. QA3]